VNHASPFPRRRAYNCEILRIGSLGANLQTNSFRGARPLSSVDKPWIHGGTIEEDREHRIWRWCARPAPRCRASCCPPATGTMFNPRSVAGSERALHTRFLAMSDRTLTGRSDAHPRRTAARVLFIACAQCLPGGSPTW